MQEYVNAFDNGKVKVEGFEEFDSELFVKNSKPKQEFILESENGMTVVLDTTLTQELINEGILREIIRNAQVLRKEANFEIDDRIEINITSEDANITNILNANSEKIKSEVLAVSYNENTFTPEIAKDIEVDDKVVKYELKRK
jgi:isoleucyl-tRNA synthetase